MTETRMVPLSKIKDNPWRDRVRNPIVPDRVESIANSIDKTGKYWLGTYGRDAEGGFVELAFGHHRYEAAKTQGLKEIPITIEPFTDGEMLVWMAQENVRGELPVVIEAVSAAVRALGEGNIEIEAPAPNTPKENLRCDPSVVAGKRTTPTMGVVRMYTMDSIARYLGYVKKSTDRAKNSVVAAMGILERAEIESLAGGKEGIEKALRVEKAFTGPSADELAKMKVNQALKELSDVNGREAKIKQRMEKTAAEIAEINEQQRKLKEKTKEREAKEKKEHDELIRKQVEAHLAENAAKAKHLQQAIKDKADKAEAAAEKDAKRIAELDADLMAKKKAAEEQRKEDEYLPHRNEADRIIRILERRDLTNELQALAHRPLTLKDRQRVWEAIDALAGWLSTWAATQFSGAPVPQSKGRKK